MGFARGTKVSVLRAGRTTFSTSGAVLLQVTASP
jgi:hypothetical protein